MNDHDLLIRIDEKVSEIVEQCKRMWGEISGHEQRIRNCEETMIRLDGERAGVSLSTKIVVAAITLAIPITTFVLGRMWK